MSTLRWNRYYGWVETVDPEVVDLRAALARAEADLRAARERIAELEGLLAMRGQA